MEGGNAVLQEQKLPSYINLYIPVLSFGILRRSTDYIHLVVRAVLSCSHEKITILK